jgi:cystathionine beta-lyase/cystathionine gamma-synthase
MKKNTKVNSSRTPIYRDAGFELVNADLTAKAFESETDHNRVPDSFIYSRYRNPTVASAEDEIIMIEKSKWALLAQSGMAAIDIALSIFQEEGDTRPWLFFSEIYGGTNSYIDSVLIKRRGVEVVRFDPDNSGYNLENLEALIVEKRPSLIYFEVISNPMLIIADATRIIEIAKRYGVKTIIDNTFSTPMLLRPLDIGADLVIHSATKYFGGHGNITAGVVCGNDSDLLKLAIEYRKFVGHMLAADEAYSLQTQIQTFYLRFRQQCENAYKIASFLYDHPLISEVLYPGLPKHPTHNIAKSLFNDIGYGAMISFDFDGNSAEIKRSRRDDFISYVSDNIRLIPTLGDSHTILMPVEPVWGYKYPEPGMIRLSVGFEDSKKIIGIIEQALSKLS